MIDGRPRQRILLVRLSAMGDVLQTLPALRALREAQPDAEIGWVVERRFAGLLEGHPAIDRLFVFERAKGGGLCRNAAAFVRLRRELREFAADVVVDAQGNLRGALVARAAGARRILALPAGEAREGSQRLATEVVAPAADPREHRSARALRLVAPLLGEPGRRASGALLPPSSTSDREAVAAALAETLGGEGPDAFVLLIAGTSDFGAFKRWPAERFGALAARIAAETDLPVLVGFGPGQEALADEIVAASGESARRAPTTRSLGELSALVRAASLVVGADSGPVVLAGAAGRPTVALFGPKDPAVYGPPGDATRVVWKRTWCAPCRLRQCDDPVCMTQLDVDDVWPSVADALGLRAGEPAA